MMEDNSWLRTLSEVRQKTMSKLPSNKSLLVLGNNGSGKTTVIAKLQGIQTPNKGIGLEYAFIDVRDEYRDDQARLGVWILDGDPALSYLLKFALSAANFQDTTIMFVVSMTAPWDILDQLKSWATILQEHIYTLNIPTSVLKKSKSECVRRWNEYVECGIGSGNESTSKRLDDHLGHDKVMFQPVERILSHNFGLDTIIVVTKTDYMATLDKEWEYTEEHFDFIQQSIRRFSLQFGAALFYTSAKEDKNCDLLYKYLIHRIYGLPFQTPALIVEKDAVFIPSGWDNMKKISILFENFITMKPEDSYKDIISPPPLVSKIFISEVVHNEDEQIFLQRLYELQKIAPKPEGPSNPSTPRTNERWSSSSPLMQTPLNSTMKKLTNGSHMDSASPCEGILANFFNSLLHKKSAGAQRETDAEETPKKGEKK